MRLDSFLVLASVAHTSSCLGCWNIWNQQHGYPSATEQCHRTVSQNSATEQCHRTVQQNSATEHCHRRMPQNSATESATEQCHRTVPQNSATEQCHHNSRDYWFVLTSCWWLHINTCWADCWVRGLLRVQLLVIIDMKTKAFLPINWTYLIIRALSSA